MWIEIHLSIFDETITQSEHYFVISFDLTSYLPDLPTLPTNLIAHS